MTTPVGGSTPHPEHIPPQGAVPPPGGKAAKAQESDGGDEKYAFLLKSPFAKMFERAGAAPTAKEMHAIMNGIMMSTFYELKRQEDHRKETDKHLKDVIEERDDA